jgi:hypothetical protein
MAMRKTTRRKLQPAGPLDWPDPEHSQYVSWWRFQFLRAALALSPEMETGLSELLRLYIGRASDRERRAAFATWAERFNLTDGWCCEWARKTVEFSHLVSLTHGDPPRLIAVYQFDGPPSVEPPALPDLTWNPFELSRELMEHRYQEYLDRVSDTYRLAGYALTPERREAAHCWWLAGYQVCGWSQNGIHNVANIDRAAVARAIDGLAKFIGLNLRPARANDPRQTAENIRNRLDSHPDIMDPTTPTSASG